MSKRIIFLVLLMVLIMAASIPAAALSAGGRVVDMEENPVPGIKVYALLAYYTNDFHLKSSLKAATLADGEGKWAFESLPLPTGRHRYWSYCFVALKPGEMLGWTNGAGELVSIPNALPAPEEGYVIPVAKLGTFEGRVTDREGNPLAGVVAKTAILLEIDEECDPGG